MRQIRKRIVKRDLLNESYIREFTLVHGLYMGYHLSNSSNGAQNELQQPHQRGYNMDVQPYMGDDHPQQLTSGSLLQRPQQQQQRLGNVVKQSYSGVNTDKNGEIDILPLRRNPLKKVSNQQRNPFKRDVEMFKDGVNGAQPIEVIKDDELKHNRSKSLDMSCTERNKVVRKRSLDKLHSPQIKKRSKSNNNVSKSGNYVRIQKKSEISVFNEQELKSLDNIKTNIYICNGEKFIVPNVRSNNVNESDKEIEDERRNPKPLCIGIQVKPNYVCAETQIEKAIPDCRCIYNIRTNKWFNEEEEMHKTNRLNVSPELEIFLNEGLDVACGGKEDSNISSSTDCESVFNARQCSSMINMIKNNDVKNDNIQTKQVATRQEQVIAYVREDPDIFGDDSEIDWCRIGGFDNNKKD